MASIEPFQRIGMSEDVELVGLYGAATRSPTTAGSAAILDEVAHEMVSAGAHRPHPSAPDDCVRDK